MTRKKAAAEVRPAVFDPEHYAEDAKAAGWTEDTCRYCGAHIGYGVPELHLGVCDKAECQARAKTAGKRRVKRYAKGRRR